MSKLRALAPLLVGLAFVLFAPNARADCPHNGKFDHPHCDATPLPAPLGQAAFVDDDGVPIGDVQTNVTSIGAIVFFQGDEIIYQSQLTTRDGVVNLTAGGPLYYDGPICSGNVYTWPVVEDLSPGVEILQAIDEDGIFYEADISMPAFLTGPLYYWDGHECRLDEGNANTFHAFPVFDASAYIKPFHLELFPAQ